MNSRRCGAFLYITILLVIICGWNTVTAQSTERPGYLSTGVGIVFKLNGDVHPLGTQFNVLEAGYELKYSLGIVGSWTVGKFNYEEESSKIDLAYYQVMLGPMYIIHLNRRSSIDLKARIGYYYREESGIFSNGSFNTHGSVGQSDLGFQFTGSYQYRVAERWTLFGNIDLTSSQMNFDGKAFLSLITLGLTAGVGFRF